ncbi:MAG TPA: 50S ribosomal protein L25, partial [Trueperaceae bacterium]|nr:50S ribosomal protein L25 [Trueperaceae bacterium]
PQHVDFYILTAGQKVDVDVKIDFVGIPLGVRNGGMADVQRREVRVNILPRLIPGTIEVDVTHLDINDSMHMSDIINLLPEEAEVLEELERTIIAIVPPRVETEVTEEDTGLAEPEVIGAKADDDGDDSE